MELWTEIVTEDVAATHIKCRHPRGERYVLVPIGDDVSMGHVREVKETIEWNRTKEYFAEEAHKLKRDLEEKKQARERLKDAGYDPAEIPI